MDASQPNLLNAWMGQDIQLTPLNKWLVPDLDCTVARLDQIHPMLSGNKLFKLWYYLEQFREGNYEGLVTFGGAYSNHLVATAFAGYALHIATTGIVRGERPPVLSPTLQDCLDYGMNLQFVSRSTYAQPEEALLKTGLAQNHLVIPEGGAGEAGIKGAALIAGKIHGFHQYSHVVCALGTGTTLQGIDRSLHKGQLGVGIPVLTIPEKDRVNFQDQLCLSPRSSLAFGYSEGGYGRRNPSLTYFMRDFFSQEGIPTDFVYTAKTGLAIKDLASRGYFPPESRILFLHTGGLQGNRSLPAGLLGY
jgi:1-aminocyclopropane-1-carboxylate deaminase/D-cysteine desulfhydrase-like pyridoxal-dependent ACC family enzyme